MCSCMIHRDLCVCVFVCVCVCVCIYISYCLLQRMYSTLSNPCVRSLRVCVYSHGYSCMYACFPSKHLYMCCMIARQACMQYAGRIVCNVCVYYVCMYVGGCVCICACLYIHTHAYLIHIHSPTSVYTYT